MPDPLHIAGSIRTELLGARKMAAALTRDLDHALDRADHALPLALCRIDDLLADAVVRLLGHLEDAHQLLERLDDPRIADPAPDRQAICDGILASPVSAPASGAAA